MTTAFEHHAILNSCRLIQDVSSKVTYILPNNKGMIEEKKGIGFLYMRDGIELLPYINGGGQEGGRRSGTENVASIVGMAIALKENVAMLEDNMKQLAELECLFINKLKTCKAEYFINGGDNRISGNISVSFKGLDGEVILHRMDLKGIEIATGSACDSKDTPISHVLKAIGLPEEYAKGTVRISLGAENTKEEVDVIVTRLIQIVESMNEGR